MYTPTRDDLVSVIQLLHNNGVEVSNSKAAYAELKKYESNPAFCVLLSTVFGADANPVADVALPVPWPQYRQLAGITLKNNLTAARHALGEDAVKEAARSALKALRNPPDARIARTSAQVVVKVTALTSFEWWSSSGLGDLSGILLGEMLPSGELKTLAALYCLQYMMEDLPKQIGASSEHIILRVSEVALSQGSPMHIRKAAFRMCFNIYEQAALLDWNVATFSPLQEGLSKASYGFSNACTALLESACGGDTAFMILVLRSCFLLLDYFDFFCPLGASEMERYSNAWIGNSAQIVCSDRSGPNKNQELVAAAIDVISQTVDLNDRNGGETGIAFLTACIPQLISSLAPALVRYSLLSDEEVANIMDTDDYRIRDSTAVSFEVQGGTKDISEDDMMDEDAAAMTLRSSALKCVDKLGSFSSEATYQALIELIQHLWRSNEWREREAGIALVGTLAGGCVRELSGVLPSLVEHFVEFIRNQSEHVCVVSIAVWALSRLSESILTSFPTAMDTILPLLSGRLQSTSKRVQWSSITALNVIHGVLENFGSSATITPHLPALLESACTCLPVYSTANLSLLVDFVCKLIPLLGDKARAERLFSILQTERSGRAVAFEQSYTAMYLREEPNVLLNKDVFALDRAVLSFISVYPSNDEAVANLNTWNTVLHDIQGRGVTDDADLIANALLICGTYATSVSTATLEEWLRSTSWAMPTAAATFLKTSSSATVKMASGTILCSLLRALGPTALPSGLHDPLLKWATAEIADIEDPQYKESVVRLIGHAASHYPGPLSADAAAALGAANAAMRSDVFSESAYYFTEMAFDLCGVLAVHPDCVMHFRVDTISQLMARAENSIAKSEASVNLFEAMKRLAPEAFAATFPSVVKVVYSWQQAAINYPGTKEAIQGFLFHSMRTCPGLLESTLQALPPSFCSTILAFYGLQ